MTNLPLAGMLAIRRVFSCGKKRSRELQSSESFINFTLYLLLLFHSSSALTEKSYDKGI